MCAFERTPLNYLVEHFNYEGVQAVTAVERREDESGCACVLLQTPDVFIGSQRQEALCPLKMNFSICCFLRTHESKFCLNERYRQCCLYALDLIRVLRGLLKRPRKELCLHVRRTSEDEILMNVLSLSRRKSISR